MAVCFDLFSRTGLQSISALAIIFCDAICHVIRHRTIALEPFPPKLSTRCRVDLDHPIRPNPEVSNKSNSLEELSLQCCIVDLLAEIPGRGAVRHPAVVVHVHLEAGRILFELPIFVSQRL